MLLLAILAFGLFAGWLAQILLGRDGYHVDWQLALIAGVAGSFVGGMLISLLAGHGLSIHPSGLIGSIAGAVIVTFGYDRWARKK